MDGYNLPSPDWFSHNIATWRQVFGEAGAPQSILEIGAYEGRSSVWMAENLLAAGGELVVVDHWQGSETLDAAGMAEVEARFDANLELVRKKVPAARIVKIKAASVQALPRLLVDGRAGSFDFIYVDGSHEAPDVLTDAALAYPLLRVGGLIAFDDYGWRRFADVNDNPKVAVDAFTNIFWKRLGLVSAGYQAFFRKLA
jgi:predicted O-methyltransferase YrrM